MAYRREPPKTPVELTHDGDVIVAQQGEPLALALLSADRVLLSRSPKLHRPRGPYCLRGACDGCLARVDGEPNVMTCLRPTRGGEHVETQNVLGSRGMDMLRATDFLFPRGMDHHRLFAGVTGLSAVVQKFARRVAGLGRMPDEDTAAVPARRREVDVLIVGGGGTGLAVAAELSGLNVLLSDDGPTFGGALRALQPELVPERVARAGAAGAELASRTTAISLSREPEAGPGLWALLVDSQGAILVRAKRVVLAPGLHDVALAYEGNDIPGTLSARAALWLWHSGIAVGREVVAIGDGRYVNALQAATRGVLELHRVAPENVVEVTGDGRVTGVVVRASGKTQKLAADAVVVDGPGAPAFELAVQAGAEVRFSSPQGYPPQAAPDGRVAEHVWAAGSVLGPARVADAARVARAVRQSLA